MGHLEQIDTYATCVLCDHFLMHSSSGHKQQLSTSGCKRTTNRVSQSSSPYHWTYCCTSSTQWNRQIYSCFERPAKAIARLSRGYLLRRVREANSRAFRDEYISKIAKLLVAVAIQDESINHKLKNWLKMIRFYENFMLRTEYQGYSWDECISKMKGWNSAGLARARSEARAWQDLGIPCAYAQHRWNADVAASITNVVQSNECVPDLARESLENWIIEFNWIIVGRLTDINNTQSEQQLRGLSRRALHRRKLKSRQDATKIAPE
jgi:hypothetical protein